ncbi:hypothetical protein NMG29_06735 [Streptomyces cocklensis]|uniref:DUF6879 domain-containing protein n=1 Tax=Actinacidiphila cocklensis TaxID=887465 RepID=A0A9W4E3V5_9ACTN|nr:DUF6879 family protein [Actinacidiphila cocklensis]MDD1057928.1 hypothetical protein [Actinacidiphila cocklensis]CAG6392795.1 conserved hypothetical protein [Actinacidiphila cocklensis]
MPQTPPPFSELLAGAATSAVHLETRDTYYSTPRFEAWRSGDEVDWADRSAWWQPFHDAVAAAVSRGVTVRRARVVSEPVTEYVRWEHYLTRANIEAGEDVRWLPRSQATRLLLPANDYWLFDGRLARIHHFAGAGDLVRDELADDPGLMGQLADAFEQVWNLAITHDEYKIQ